MNGLIHIRTPSVRLTHTRTPYVAHSSTKRTKNEVHVPKLPQIEPIPTNPNTLTPKGKGPDPCRKASTSLLFEEQWDSGEQATQNGRGKQQKYV